MAETCFCRTGLNRFKPRFKPPLAETCQPWFVEEDGLGWRWVERVGLGSTMGLGREMGEGDGLGTEMVGKWILGM